MPKREIGHFDQVRGNQDLGTKIFEKLSKNKIFLAKNVIHNFVVPKIFQFYQYKLSLGGLFWVILSFLEARNGFILLKIETF